MLTYHWVCLSQPCSVYIGLGDGPTVSVETTHHLSRRWPMRDAHDATLNTVVAHGVVQKQCTREACWRTFRVPCQDFLCFARESPLPFYHKNDLYWKA